MPQMSPMNWIILFFYFLLIFYWFNMMNYYIFTPKIYLSMKPFIFKKIKLNWKW